MKKQLQGIYAEVAYVRNQSRRLRNRRFLPQPLRSFPVSTLPSGLIGMDRAIVDSHSLSLASLEASRKLCPMYRKWYT